MPVAVSPKNSVLGMNMNITSDPESQKLLHTVMTTLLA